MLRLVAFSQESLSNANKVTMEEKRQRIGAAQSSLQVMEEGLTCASFSV